MKKKITIDLALYRKLLREAINNCDWGMEQCITTKVFFKHNYRKAQLEQMLKEAK